MLRASSRRISKGLSVAVFECAFLFFFSSVVKTASLPYFGVSFSACALVPLCRCPEFLFCLFWRCRTYSFERFSVASLVAPADGLTNLLFSNDVQCPPPKKASYSVSCSFHERVARRLTFFGERPREPRCLRELQIKSVVPQFSLHACVHEHVFFGVVGTPYLSKLLFQGCHENWLAFFFSVFKMLGFVLLIFFLAVFSLVRLLGVASSKTREYLT